MKTPALALAVLTLTACGHETGVYACDAAPFLVSADYPLNCETVRANVALTRRILDERGILPAADFESTFSGVPVLVRNTTVLKTTGEGEWLLGSYGTGGIELTYNTSALLHECLHHLDRVWVHPFSYYHEGWDRGGWTAAADQYDHEQHSPSFDANGPLTKPENPQ